MTKFILLGFFLSFLTIMFFLPAPMDKIEYTLEQGQLPFLKELSPNHQENIPIKNDFRALLVPTQEEKSSLTGYPTEKNKIIYQHKLAISSQSLNY